MGDGHRRTHRTGLDQYQANWRRADLLSLFSTGVFTSSYESMLIATPSQRFFVQNDVDPVLLVTLLDAPTACCHLRHRSLTFLRPVSGDRELCRALAVA